MSFKRSLGFAEFLCLGINCVVGTGIFLIPALVYKNLGPSGIVAYLVCGTLCMFIGLCFCEMSGRFEKTGGAALYAGETLGPLMGFLVGWQMWLSSLVGWASVARGFYFYWRALVPPLFPHDDIALLVIIIAGLSALNYRGVKMGSRVSDFFALSKLVPLLLFLAAGLFCMKSQNFVPFFRGALPEWGAALVVVFYAFTGFEEISLPAAEGKDPRKDVPRALLFVLGGASIIYMLVQTVTTGVFQGLASSEKPLSDAAFQCMGRPGEVFVALGALLSIGGINSAIALTGPRALYTLAASGFLPRWLTVLHRSHGTPGRAIVVNSVLTFALAATGTFEVLLKLSVLAALWQHLPTCIAVLVARKKFAEPSAFTIPGGPVVPLCAVLICIVLVSQVEPLNILWSIVGLAAGLPLYLYFSRVS
ncbi:MAG: APC family permease [Candidatus Eremiobacteraeota bacterium]|nr:APC family permease [Candidatus Eremiobacteraeota bacterium]